MTVLKLEKRFRGTGDRQNRPLYPGTFFSSVYAPAWFLPKGGIVLSGAAYNKNESIWSLKKYCTNKKNRIYSRLRLMLELTNSVHTCKMIVCRTHPIDVQRLFPAFLISMSYIQLTIFYTKILRIKESFAGRYLQKKRLCLQKKELRDKTWT